MFTNDKKCIFFHSKVAHEISEYFREHGKGYTFRKKTVVPNGLVENNLLFLESGLLSNTQYITFCSKDKFSVFILPNRLVDHQLILIKEFTACKSIEVLRDSEILALKYDTVQKLVEDNVPLHRALLRECAYCSRRYMHLPIYISSIAAEQKAIRFFHDILVAHGMDLSAPWLHMPIKLTREEISNALYISLASYDLIINKWYKSNLMKRENNYLVINTDLIRDVGDCSMESIKADQCIIHMKYCDKG